MSTSNTPSADKRSKPVRKVPRRHEDSKGNKAAATYDGGEFPVLLRMPLVALENLSVASDEDDEGIEEAPQPEAVVHTPSSPARRTKRSSQRHRSKETEHSRSEESRTTALSSVEFWRSLAPKIAVGGMLLSVLAICGVMFMGPRGTTTLDNSSSEWSKNSANTATSEPDNHAFNTEIPHEHPDSNARPITKNESSGDPLKYEHRGHEEVASNPSLFPNASVDKTVDIPRMQTDPSVNNNIRSTEPKESYSIPNARPHVESYLPLGPELKMEPTAPSGPAEPFRAPGWPDDSLLGNGNSGSTAEAGFDAGPQLNPAADPSTASLRTSFRQPRASNNQPPSGGVLPSGTRLKGTINLPDPRTGLR